jgi:hypothetical protein
MSSLPDLSRRLSKKIEQHKTIQLSPDDLDLLVSTGAYAAILRATEEQQRDQCLQRSARNRSISGENINSTPETVGTSKSSGMTKTANANELLAQVREMLPGANLPSTGNI